MSNVRNTDIVDAPELQKNARSGRPSWDERGNTVWEWQTEPGIYSREVDTQQLKKLQASELQLLDQNPGVTSTYSHWKRQYPERAAPTRGTELVMPVTRKVDDNKSGMFESFLKELGLAG
jgi:hypothetical protein